MIKGTHFITPILQLSTFLISTWHFLIQHYLNQNQLYYCFELFLAMFKLIAFELTKQYSDLPQSDDRIIHTPRNFKCRIFFSSHTAIPDSTLTSTKLHIWIKLKNCIKQIIKKKNQSLVFTAINNTFQWTAVLYKVSNWKGSISKAIKQRTRKAMKRLLPCLCSFLLPLPCQRLRI